MKCELENVIFEMCFLKWEVAALKVVPSILMYVTC